MTLSRRAALIVTMAALSACGRKTGRHHADSPAEINALIDKYARQYDVPADLVHRVVKRESGYDPRAHNGPYIGLMQILPGTAHTMGFRGLDSELFDADTNLRYGVKYLRGAWLLSNGSYDTAVMWYARGYYYEAKRRGMLVETGLRAS